VQAMRALEELPEVEKTSMFGMAVHAVLRSADVDPETLASRLDEANVRDASFALVEPSLEDVFLDLAERSAP
jgi:ABC-type uncharacterized transport system ATPase subunit